MSVREDGQTPKQVIWSVLWESTGLKSSAASCVTDDMIQALTSAGYTIERGWCDDMSLAPERFLAYVPNPPEEIGKSVVSAMSDDEGGWMTDSPYFDGYGWEYIGISPTHWRLITPPNGGE